MKLQRKIYTTRREKVTDFIIGAVIFFLLNGLTIGLNAFSGWAASTHGFWDKQPFETLLDLLDIALICLPWVLNILMIVLFALTRSWMALGMVGVVGFFFVLGMIALVISMVVCFAGGGFS